MDDAPVLPPVRRRKKKKKLSASEEVVQGVKELLAPAKAWLPRLAVCVAVFAAVIAGIAMFAPGGVIIAARVLMATGSLMILLGFGIGAYGACSEGFIQGFLYLVIPCYCAYYFVTRWDDLWIWFACMTAGVGLASLGIEMTQWGAAAG